MPLSNYDPGQELSSINFAGMIGGPLTAAVDAQSQAALATVDFIKSVGFTPDVVDANSGAVTPGSPIYVTFKYPKQVAPYVPAVTGGELATAILDTTTPTPGSGYTVGDILTLGTGGATVKVETITGTNTTGPIATVSVVTGGSGYTATTNMTATGGTGSGAKLTVTTKDAAAVPAQFAEMRLEVPILTMLPIPYLRIDFVEIDFNAKITSMEYREVGSSFQASASFALNNSSSYKNRNASVSRSMDLKVNASYQSSVNGGFKIDKTYQLGVKLRATQDEMPGGMERRLGILEDAIISQPTGAVIS